eukprot:27193-Eustigmatos_ZCMA.PRE.1
MVLCAWTENDSRVSRAAIVICVCSCSEGERRFISMSSRGVYEWDYQVHMVRAVDSEPSSGKA